MPAPAPCTRRAPAALLVLAALAGGACTGLPSERPGRAAPADAAGLFVASAGPALEAGAVPLLVPNASWLAADLEPLAADRATRAYDLRGRGRSEALPADAGRTLEDDVADLEALRVALGVERMALLGWAYGGQVVLRYALAHRERVERLVLVNPLPARRRSFWRSYLRAYARRLPVAERERVEQLRATGVKERNPERYCRAVVEASLGTFVADREALERMRSRPCVLPNLDPDVTARHAESILAALGNWDWTEELQGLDLPVLVVHGAQGLVPHRAAEHLAQALPCARLVVLEGVGHMPWLEDPAAFFPPVRAFLAGEVVP